MSDMYVHIKGSNGESYLAGKKVSAEDYSDREESWKESTWDVDSLLPIK